jgi:predicted nucleic acid-binding protein
VALILDTGPLYASLDRSDAAHESCRRLIEQADEPLVIPAPVLVEVDYWIHTRLHPGVLVALLADIESGAYRVEDLLPADYARVHSLCARYDDADIGFVDAAVLAIVERLRETQARYARPASLQSASTASRRCAHAFALIHRA